MKPAPDMFVQVQEALGLAPAASFMWGSPGDRRAGARLHGFRAAWLNESGQSWQSLSLLPDVELGQLQDLATLLL